MDCDNFRFGLRVETDSQKYLSHYNNHTTAQIQGFIHTSTLRLNITHKVIMHHTNNT